MKQKKLIVEKLEYVTVKKLLYRSGHFNDPSLQRSVKKLSEEMKLAEVLDASQMPEDIVRIGCLVTISSGVEWKKTVQLVLPRDQDIKKDKISLLTPMGTAIYGYAAGDEVLWEFPKGEKRLKIESVVAPIKNGLIISL